MGTVLSVSLRAGLIGALITAIGVLLLATTPSSIDSFVGNLTFAGFVFLIALVVGTIATALCLTIFGLPAAHLLQRSLATPTGATMAMLVAIVASAIVAFLISGGPAILVILPFSIPAAIYFRRDILLERELP